MTESCTTPHTTAAQREIDDQSNFTGRGFIELKNKCVCVRERERKGERNGDR